MNKFLAAIVLVLLGAAARGGPALVFGSYVNPEFAEAKAEQVAAVLGVRAELVTVDVKGVRYVRVVSPASLPDAALPELLSKARASGFDGVWRWGGRPPRAGATERTAVAPPQDVATPAFPQATPRQTSPPPAPAVATTGAPSTPAAAPRGPASGNAAAASSGADWRLSMRPASADELAIVVPRLNEAQVSMSIDGRLDEAIWNDIPGYDNMTVTEPDTMAAPGFQTVSRYFYTEKGLYIGVWNQQPPETLIARLSSRDDYINRDSWGITLDTSGEGLYGYWFSVNLGGSVMDGKVAPERDYSREWDGPWSSGTAKLDDGWSAELFLPWSMMSMPRVDDDRQMGFWVNRKVAYVDERYSWPALPFTGARFMSALGSMQMPDVTPKQQLSFFPYTSATYDGIYEQDEYKLGVDAFWRPSSNLQLTATLNPDFGAVESDDVVVNLTATEEFFPEKRLFFLEGNEIFATSPRARVRGFGGSGGSSSSGARRTPSTFNPRPQTLLNTRRIGGAPLIDIPDELEVPAVEQSRPTDLLGAAKVTGQGGPLRYGVMTAIEDDPELRATDAEGNDMLVSGDGRNFVAARVLLESSGDSRKSVGYLGTLVDHPDRQSIAHGIDAHALTNNGKLRSDVQLVASDADNEYGYGAWGDFAFTQRRGIVHQVSFDLLDDTIELNDFGFLSRRDFYGGRYAFQFTDSSMQRFRQWRSQINLGHWVNGKGRNVRTGVFLRNSLMFNNRSEIRTELNYFPERWEDLESRGNGSYKLQGRWVAEVGYGSDTSKKLSYSILGGARQEDLEGWQYTAAVGLTLKPIDRFSLDADLTYRYRESWVLHQGEREFTSFTADDLQPRVALDVFITARQQIRWTMQWAGIVAEEKDFYRVPVDDGWLIPVTKAPGAPSDDFSISRITTQFRYRWEIAPLSDLFVVYTRGSNFGSGMADEFGSLFESAIRDPIVDFFVVKLRYRFGV